MFRSSTIIREFSLNPAKVIFALKHLVKLRLYLLCGCVAAYCILQHAAVSWHTTATLTRFSASSLMMVEDHNM
jgi:hypothetical protein